MRSNLPVQVVDVAAHRLYLRGIVRGHRLVPLDLERSHPRLDRRLVDARDLVMFVGIAITDSASCAIAAADHMITVDVTGFGSLAWRRSDDLIKRGYEAADKMSAELLKYAVSEPEWKAWLDARTARRRTTIPQPQFITTAGLTQVDAILVRRQLAHHMSVALDVPSLEKDLARLSGLDRYEGLTWLITGPPGREGLMIRAKEKTYAPPFLMMRINLENTASDDFRAQVAGRYLAFDVLGTSTELRIDAVLGSDPSIATSWYRPIVGRLFVRPYAAASKRTFDVFVEEQNVAVYREGRMFAGGISD